MMRFVIYYCFLVLVSFSFSSGASDAEVVHDPIKNSLVMGFVPSRSVHKIQLNSKKIAEHLGKITGYQIKAVTLSNYAAIAVAMKSGRVDLAFVGPLSFLVINNKVPVRPITAALRHGMKGYHSLIITRSDSNINNLSEARGRSFIFGDRLSASANLYPRDALQSVGIDPKKDLKSLTMGSQSAIVMSVLKGKADLGAIYDDARDNSEIKHYAENVFVDTKVLWRSKLIPADPQIVRAAMHPIQQEILRDALLNLHNDSDAKVWLKELYGIDKLVPTMISDYDSLVEIVARIAPELNITGGGL